MSNATSPHLMMRIGNTNRKTKPPKKQLTVSIFAKTMRKAIWNYRSLLRKYLPHHQRMMKLRELGLRQKTIRDEMTLYQIGYKIVMDIESNFDPLKNGYYSYSGVESFGSFLKEFLSNYVINKNKVVHRTQKAANALVQAIQLLYTEKYPLTHDIEQDRNKLEECNQFIALYGSQEQQDMYLRCLQEIMELRNGEDISFYNDIRSHFSQTVETVSTDVG